MRATAGRAGLMIATGVSLVVLSAAPASASSGSPVYSADQVGYAATGANFDGSEIQVKLPDASRYAAEVGQIGISLQLWTQHRVVVFTMLACTDTTCRPGGRPETRKYRLDISVYSRATGRLICSTTAARARQRCVDAFPSWNRVRLSPGTTELLDLQYNKPQALMLASANALNAAVPVTGVGTMRQARIVIQFGATPFSKAFFLRPRKKMPFLTVGTFAGEFILGNGQRSVYIGSGLIRRHKVDMTATGRAGRLEAFPSGVYDYGAFFHTYFTGRT